MSLISHPASVAAQDAETLKVDAPSAPQRVQSLDVLRGIAILLVIGHHLPEAPRTLFLPLRLLFDGLRKMGWSGVDLFFVLSGFLISGLIYKEHKRTGTFRPMYFLARRGFKIYPQFYLLMLVTLLLKPFIISLPISRWFIVYQALFLQNYLGGINGHTWSLAIEEHFYIFLAILLWYLTRKGSTRINEIPRIAALIAVSVLFIRIVNYAIRPYDFLTHYGPTHLRIDALMFGVLLGYWSQYEQNKLEQFCRMWRGWIAAGVVLLLLPALYFPHEESWYSNTIGFTAVYAAYGGLLLIAKFNFELAANFSLLKAAFALIAWIGFYSYSIYIWHVMFILYGIPRIQRFLGAYSSFLLNVAICVVAVVIFGALAAVLVEIPMLKLRDRFFPSRSQSSASSS